MRLKQHQQERNGSGRLLDDILAVEIAAGRMEGAFQADPELGRMWRTQLALGEACKSVALEDIYLSEGDLVLRRFENRDTAYATARGSSQAEALLRIMVSPGDLFADPATVLMRCLRAGSGASMGGGAGPDGAGEDWPDIDILSARILSAAGAAPGPALAAIRAAAHLRLATGSRYPAAERLLFICADHACRRGEGGMDIDTGAEGAGADAILGQMSADWILLPSLAMTAQGFRAWSPVSRTGLHDLLAGLRIETGRALGQVPVLRRWRDRARVWAAAAHGKSHLDDLVTLAIRQPILTGRAIAEGLGVTDRTARNLIHAGVAEQLFAPITGRRSYRAWASLPMAERLRLRMTRPAQRGRASEAAAMPHPLRPMAEPDGAGEAQALADLDAAMAAADDILARYRRPDG